MAVFFDLDVARDFLEDNGGVLLQRGASVFDVVVDMKEAYAQRDDLQGLQAVVYWAALGEAGYDETRLAIDPATGLHFLKDSKNYSTNY